MTIGLFVLAVIVGYIRKGRLKNLLNLDIKLTPLFILSLLIHLLINLSYTLDIVPIQEYDVLLYFSSYIILFAALMGNFDNKWFVFISLGVILNFVAIFLNGGKMPISYEAAASIGISSGELELLLRSKAGTHQVFQETTVLWFLGDIIPIRFPNAMYFLSNIYSIGDFVLFSGMFGFIQSAMADKTQEEYLESSLIEDKSTVEGKVLLYNQEIDETYLNQIQTAPDISEESDDLKIDTLEVAEEVEEVEETEAIEEKEAYVKEDEEEAIEEKNVYIIEEPIEEKDAYIKEGEEEIEDLEELKPVEEFAEEPIDEPEAAADEALDKVMEEEKFTDEKQIPNTIDQFIIVDGKIKENPYYGAEIEDDSNKNQLPAVDQYEPVEEIEMEQLDLKQIKDKKINAAGHSNVDEDYKSNKTSIKKQNKELKKRLKEGYEFIEVKIGSKKINFWRKDL